jgi:hypothetical protein
VRLPELRIAAWTIVLVLALIVRGCELRGIGRWGFNLPDLIAVVIIVVLTPGITLRLVARARRLGLNLKTKPAVIATLYGSLWAQYFVYAGLAYGFVAAPFYALLVTLLVGSLAGFWKQTPVSLIKLVAKLKRGGEQKAENSAKR